MKTKSILILALLFAAFACQKENATTPDEILNTSNAVQSFVPYSVIYNPVSDSTFLVSINDAGSYAIMDTTAIEKSSFKFYLDAIDSVHTGPNFQWSIQIDQNGFTQMYKVDLTAVPQ